MPQRGPWSVKGIDSRAREVAREAARGEGVTLGAYLNKLILEEGVSEDEQSSLSPDAMEQAETNAQTDSFSPYAVNGLQDPAAKALDRLTRRIESAEARSTLAITGIDQSVVGLLARLENAEHGQQALGNHLDTILEDIRDTYDALSLKVQAIEADDASATNLKALRALEDALGKLASHVYEENELIGEEANAIKARLESGLTDLSDQMQNLDSRIDEKVVSATRSFEEIIASAELRTEGTAKHLAERLTTIEVDVANKLLHVEEMGRAMTHSQTSMNGKIEHFNASLADLQARLEQAELTTNTAMRGLENRFEALDTQLTHIQSVTGEEVNQKLRDHFDGRFETLSDNLRDLIASTRADLAVEIEAASKSVDEEVLTRIEGSIASLGRRLDASEDLHAQTMEMVSDTVTRITDSVDQRLLTSQDQQSRAIQQISTQMTRLTEGLDARFTDIDDKTNQHQADLLRDEISRFTSAIDDRLDAIEHREDASLQHVSDEMGKLTEQLESRLHDSEARSADAVRQISQQVSGMAQRLESNQAETFRGLAEKTEAAQHKQEARLSHAIQTVSDQLERVQEQSLTTLSPIQKAIAALAQRLEAVEDFASPPYAERALWF